MGTLIDIKDIPLRIYGVTSSQVHLLMKKGNGIHGFEAGALTYIEEKRMNKLLGRSVAPRGTGRAALWGNFMEMYVFSQLPLGYTIHSKTTFAHPYIHGWSGSPDVLVIDKLVGDIKCYEPKNFVATVQVMRENSISLLREKCPEEYWQLVSNAAITGVPVAQLILFMPYQSQLAEIRELAANYDGDAPWQYRWIYESKDADLPYIPDGNPHFKNLEIFEFEVPQEDIERLMARVITAVKMINE